MSNQTKSAGQDFAALLKEREGKITIPQVGDTVKGKILSASKAEVKIDIGGFLTGVVRGRELYFEASEFAGLKPGEEIEATVIEPENENGELELSFRFAGQEKAWQSLTEAYEKKQPISVKINAANRGGLMVSYAQIQAFLPVSQLSPENYPRVSGGDKTKIFEKLKSLVGTEAEVRIIALDRKEEKLVVSEKDAWQEKQKDVISQYAVGDSVEGSVIAVTGFGVFVNFGGNLEGLIHISQLAWQRIEDPSDLYKVGDNVKAQIIGIEGAKIFLSVKNLLDDPWKNVEEKYAVGKNVEGKILKVNPFGLFIELDQDIHGLAHISQLGLTAGKKIEDAFKAGETATFEVISLDSKEHRLGLAVPGKARSRKPKNEKNKDKEDTTEDEVEENTKDGEDKEGKKDKKGKEEDVKGESEEKKTKSKDGTLEGKDKDEVVKEDKVDEEGNSDDTNS